MGYKNLTTKYEKDIEKTPWNVYPRPQMKRDSFICLNGTWELFFPGKKSGSLQKYKITVPFPPESKISGIGKKIPSKDTFVYSRTFEFEKPDNQRVILHFGGVDCFCRVFVNNYAVGSHEGGYTPFSFDITHCFSKKSRKNEITVECIDATDKVYPYGKQSLKRGGIWYTAISGIWQTVWMETVPNEYVKSIKIDTSINKASFHIEGGVNEKTLEISTPTGPKSFDFSGNEFEFYDDRPRNWSPSDPYLYEYTLVCKEDRIKGYFALREISCENGSFLLNKKKIFLHGLLDQGYYSDGIYLPATVKGYEDDILLAKQAGFNTLRKHIKLEPMIFYHLCDKHGMLVMQDMINNGKYSFFRDSFLPTLGIKRILLPIRSKKEKEQFINTSKKIIDTLYSSPSVIYYTIFNEGWGQFSHKSLYDDIKKSSGNRIIDTASGWFYQKKSDVYSHHIYFKKINLRYRGDKPTVISEFGGYSLRIKGNTFNNKTFGYSKKRSSEQLFAALEKLYRGQITPEIKKGLGGAVYTQLSDVEDELNGIVTYDRQVIKIDPKKLKELSNEIYKAFEENK